MSRTRKKKQNPAGWIVLSLFVLMILFALYRFVFIVRYVNIEGTSSVTLNEILRAADIGYERSIFFCSEEKVRKGIDALGEIELVSVKKKYPSTIIIEVRQRTPSMIAVHQSEIVVMDEKGYVISVGDTIPSDTIYFTGLHILYCKPGAQISAENGQLEAMCEISSAIRDANGIRYVSEIDIDDLSDIKITAVNDTIVEVGTVESIEAKMAWMTAAVADLVGRNQEGGTLDVTSGTKADYVLPPVVEETII